MAKLNVVTSACLMALQVIDDNGISSTYGNITDRIHIWAFSACDRDDHGEKVT